MSRRPGSLRTTGFPSTYPEPEPPQRTRNTLWRPDQALFTTLVGMSGPAASTLHRARAWSPLLAEAARALNRFTSFVPPPPSVSGSDRLLLVVVHPYGKQPSYTLALGNAVCDSLVASGTRYQCHSLGSERLVDLCFDAVLIGAALWYTQVDIKCGVWLSYPIPGTGKSHLGWCKGVSWCMAFSLSPLHLGYIRVGVALSCA